MIVTSESPASVAGDAVVPCRHFRGWLIPFAYSCCQYPALEYCYKDWHALLRGEEQSRDIPFLRKMSKSVVSVKGAEGGTSCCKKDVPWWAGEVGPWGEYLEGSLTGNLDPFWIIFLFQSKILRFLAGGLLDPEQENFLYF